MTTVVELRKQANDLKLKGYSKLNKPELEKLIDDEWRRREQAELEIIRTTITPRPRNGNPAEAFPVNPLEFDPIVEPEIIRGLGISNRIRLGHYLCQTDGRKRLTAAQARRMRKHWRAGDISVSSAAVFAGVNVLLYL